MDHHELRCSLQKFRLLQFYTVFLCDNLIANFQTYFSCNRGGIFKITLLAEPGYCLG